MFAEDNYGVAYIPCTNTIDSATMNAVTEKKTEDKIIWLKTRQRRYLISLARRKKQSSIYETTIKAKMKILVSRIKVSFRA